MAEIRIVRDYPQPPEKVWRALTDAALIPRWTSTGAGGRPEGLGTAVGTKFRYVAKPKPGWSGTATPGPTPAAARCRRSPTGWNPTATALASPTSTPASPASAASSWPDC